MGSSDIKGFPFRVADCETLLRLQPISGQQRGTGLKPGRGVRFKYADFIIGLQILARIVISNSFACESLFN
jgi:hypothetical protein